MSNFMGFIGAVKTCFKKYITFSGRASRSEYWYFFLFNFLASFLLGGISRSLFSNLYLLMVFLPYLAVLARRLHDLNFHGWWMLLGFVSPVIAIFTAIAGLGGGDGPGPGLLLNILGSICLIFPLIFFVVFLAWRGTIGENRFGPDPLIKGSNPKV